MIKEFKIFWDDHFGRINIPKNPIEFKMGQGKPVEWSPYRAGPKAREFQKSEIDKILEMMVIGAAESDCWAAPIVFAPNIGGSFRFYVDYRTINVVSKRNSYPYPEWPSLLMHS